MIHNPIFNSTQLTTMMEMIDFTERLQNLAKKMAQVAPNLETEEATKNALIMPFLHQVLGYDVFDPSEVVPEYSADTPGKRNEKVDYAILKDGSVQILIECKRFREKLSIKHASQLFRYFSVSQARIGVLTNGVIYEFYTDLDQPNIMDGVPFLTLNLAEIDKAIVPEVKKLTKSSFNIDSVVDAAGELKYLTQIKRALSEQFNSPDDELVRFLTSKVYSGIQTPKIKAQFSVLIQKALKQFLSDSVNARLKSAMGDDDESPAITTSLPTQTITAAPATTSNEEQEPEGPRVNTTQEELDGFHIVRAILRKRFDVARIIQRDTQSYFGILLDDNNRKPLCRLHFNAKQKYIGIVGEDKNETRHPIDNLDQIYDFADKLLENAARFE